MSLANVSALGGVEAGEPLLPALDDFVGLLAGVLVVAGRPSPLLLLAKAVFDELGDEAACILPSSAGVMAFLPFVPFCADIDDDPSVLSLAVRLEVELARGVVRILAVELED